MVVYRMSFPSFRQAAGVSFSNYDYDNSNTNTNVSSHLCDKQLAVQTVPTWQKNTHHTGALVPHWEEDPLSAKAK